MSKTLFISGIFVVGVFVATLFLAPHTVSLEGVVRPSLIDRLPVINYIWHKASVSLGDYNADGWVDVFVTTNARGYLYRNTGASFERVSDEETQVAFERVHMGLWGDIDNDGCKDLYVTRQAPYQHGLYRNNCDGSFSDASRLIQPSISVNGFGASFIDINNDGFLDVFSVSFDRDNYKNFSVRTTPEIDYTNIGQGFNPVVFKEDNIFLVQKDGHFTPYPSASDLRGDFFGSRECMEANGISRESDRKLGPKFGFKQAYQPVWFDADGDGMLDVWVTYDYGFSALYKQLQDGSFRDVTEASGLCKLGNAMGVAVGDIDSDGDLDVYETNVGSNYLFLNDGGGTFREVGAEARVVDYKNSGWGTSFADFNNDTALDIIVSNGREIEPSWPYDEMDKLFLNKKNGTFEELPIDHVSLFSVDTSHPRFNADAAAAVGDLNNDGFPDAVVFRPHTGTLYALYGKPNGNHWLSISLTGEGSNRDAIGATVILESGDTRQVRIVTAGSSYLSQDDTRQLFGLGANSRIDTLTVLWPGGTVDVFRDIMPDQNLELTEGMDL